MSSEMTGFVGVAGEVLKMAQCLMVRYLRNTD